jgi:dipeptidyl aminopeptidase/acylaminoacyl peptidase
MKIFPFRYLLFFSLVTLISCSEDSSPKILTSVQLLEESYGSHLRQKMDVFLPAGRTSETTPLLVYIHGGAWIDGDKSEFLQVKSLIEKEFPDYAFVSLNYRLYDFATGSNGISDQEEDIISAFNYIESQLVNWNVSGDMVISGASAGGHLALLHAFKNHTSDLKAVVAFFPPTDLTSLHGFNNLTASTLDLLLGGTPTTAKSAYQNSSPVNFIDPQDVPTIFFHGAQDQVVPITQSERLEEVLLAAGVRHRFRAIPGQGHGFTSETYAELLHEAKNFIGEF